MADMLHRASTSAYEFLMNDRDFSQLSLHAIELLLTAKACTRPRGGLSNDCDFPCEEQQRDDVPLVLVTSPRLRRFQHLSLRFILIVVGRLHGSASALYHARAVELDHVHGRVEVISRELITSPLVTREILRLSSPERF